MPRLERLPSHAAPKEVVATNPDQTAEMSFEDSREVARAMLEARKILKQYLDQEPKLKDLMETPQSADKHGEGPRILDHYQHILASLVLFKRGFFTYERTSQALDLEGRREQWEDAIRFIRENYGLMLAFSICHDLAKSDTLGIYAKAEEGIKAGFPAKRDFHLKKKDMTAEERQAWREKYAALEAGFAASHPEITDPSARMKAFFEKYGITATYIGHENVTPENRVIIERVSAGLGLSEKDIKLLVFSIQNHVSGLLSFDKGPRDYHSLVMLAEAAGVDVRDAILSLQAGIVTDGMMGVRKWNASGTGFELPSEVLHKFWQAEKDYPAFKAEEERRASEKADLLRLREIAAQVGLRGDDLKDLGINVKIGFQKFVLAIYDAIRKDVDLDRQELVSIGLKVEAIDEIDRRIHRARELYLGPTRKNPFEPAGG